MDDILINLSNWLSISMCGLFLIPIFLYLLNPSMLHIKGFIGIILTPFIADLIKKYITISDYPRPDGAKDCDLFCMDGNQTGRPGMPSGHTATVVFFTAYYFKETNNIYLKFLMILYTALIMLSRYLKRCHTINQIVGGTILGLIVAGILVRLL